MLELYYDLLRERQRPEDVEPLQVVVDKRGLHIVRGHRRSAALCMLQGMWRYRTVLAPCLLYKADDPVVARQFLDMDTEVDGLGLHLHGRRSEAWHRGKPLFRTSEEWCDSVAAVPVEEPRNSPEVRPEVRPTRFNKSDMQNSRRSEALRTSAACPSDPMTSEQLPKQIGTGARQLAASDRGGAFDSKFAFYERNQLQRKLTDPQVDLPAVAESQDLSVGVSSESRAVCCMWLAGKCWHKGDHFLGKRLFLHEDVPGLQCGFGSSCKHKHYAQLKEGMVICVKVEGSRLMPGKILQLSRLEGVRVKVSNLGKRDEVDWLPLHRLLIPDFSQIEKGMRVTVVEEADSSKQFLCTVLEVSCDKDRALAPVCVRYNGHGPESDEWVGVDRLRSKSLKLHEPVLPTRGMSLGQQNGSAATSRWQTVEPSCNHKDERYESSSID